jgi:tRNA(adenine34) deaminase
MSRARKAAQNKIDVQWMELALQEAAQAARENEVPVGAVIVSGEETLLARAHNTRQGDRDPTEHAELKVIRTAAREQGTWQLVDCTIYVTLEPCAMCAGALVNARIKRLVYGCADPKGGAVRTLYTICDDPRLNHRLDVRFGVLAERCADLLSSFFARLRDR